MHPITFGTKRAYHGFLRLTRRAFASVGLTAARFDMLLAIRGSIRADERLAEGGIGQADLPYVLGVSKSVVSRMLKSLKELGLVQHCHWYDRRYHCVWTTEKGEAVFRAARDMLMRCVQRVVVTAVCFGRRRNRQERQGRLQQLEAFLTALRVYFGDKAPLGPDWTKRTQPVPPLERWGPPAMLLGDWSPATASAGCCGAPLHGGWRGARATAPSRPAR